MKGNFKKNLFLNIGISLGIVAVLLIANFFLNSDIAGRVQEIRRIKNESADKAKAIESLVLLKDEERRADRLEATLDALLPTQEGILAFRQALSRLASDNNLELTFFFRDESPAEGDKTGFTNFQFTVKGTGKSFTNFLKAIDGMHYLVSLDKIEYTRTGGAFTVIASGKVFSR